MKILLVPLVLSTLFLAGCDPQQVQPIVNKYHVVLAPDSMYNCPVVKSWPKIQTLTDLQTARLIVDLAEKNKICKSSMVALKSFYENAKAKFESVKF